MQLCIELLLCILNIILYVFYSPTIDVDHFVKISLKHVFGWRHYAVTIIKLLNFIVRVVKHSNLNLTFILSCRQCDSLYRAEEEL